MNITYFPIRHHSPACAAHLARWITANQPSTILIEGPESLTPMIGLLLDPDCVPPVAFYTSFVDQHNRLQTTQPHGPARFAAYYPLCDHSPELAALRQGREVGAQLRFIDLDYAETLVAQKEITGEAHDTGARISSLMAETHLRHSQYVQALAQRMGCRNFDELWDHWFEAAADTLDTETFMERIATYCAMARSDYPAEALDADGTTAREACMAAAIAEALTQQAETDDTRPILVVTGGLHTVALPELAAQSPQRPPRLHLDAGEAGIWLIRYSFDQLDALAGYASGMPSPAFYDRMWRAAIEAPADAAAIRTQEAMKIIVDIGRLTRETNLPEAISASTPDAIAAAHMTQQLAQLRGHPWPLREDLLDGMRSCFVKGEMHTEGHALMQRVYQLLAGNRIGQIPAGAAAPPIVDDFNRQAEDFRLPLDAVVRKDIALDLYRNPNHRQLSRFFHQLDGLGVPFAAFVKGPDFVHGHGLERMQEHWQAGWSPAVESALIEASIYGPTLEDAALAKWHEQVEALDADGKARNAAEAVSMLVRACRMGLHRHTGDMLPRVDRHIVEDPLFSSVVSGLSQLELLQRSREPLEAMQLTAVPRFMQAAYRRACRLLHDLKSCPDDEIAPCLNALSTLREIIHGAEFEGDNALFHQALARLIQAPPDTAQPAIIGAAAGLLYSEQHLTEDELVRITCGYLGATDLRTGCGFLQGLLAMVREIAWHVTAITQAIDAQLRHWDEDAFLKALPELRLAFTALTPREVSRVAEQVARYHGEISLGNLVETELHEHDVHLALELTQYVRQVQQDDGLTG